TFRPRPGLPKWRNWQTRQLQELVPVTGVEVRVLSSALQKSLDFPGFLRFWTVKRLPPFALGSSFFLPFFCCAYNPLSRRERMAGLQQKGGTWFCQFYELGNRYTVTAGLDRAEAETFAGGVELLL